MPHFHCVAPGCNSDSRKNCESWKYKWMKNVSFHPFPKPEDKAKRKRWLELVRREPSFNPKRFDRVCSFHFANGKGPTAEHPYPTRFGYNNYGHPLKARRSLAQKRQVLNSDTAFTSTNTTSVNTTQETQEDVFKDSESPPDSCCVALTTKSHERQNASKISRTEDIPTCSVIHTPAPTSDHVYAKLENPTCYTTSSVGVQTDISGIFIEELLGAGKKKCRPTSSPKKNVEKPTTIRNAFVKHITGSDKHVKFFTGFPNLAILLMVFNVLKPLANGLSYWKGGKNTGRYRWKKLYKNRALTLWEEFILTLVKLRIGMPNMDLTWRFGVSNTTVSVIFSTWINFLYIHFKDLIVWPSADIIQANMPNSFKVKYPKTRAIIDCTEFFVQRPSAPTAQSLLYSSYKQHTTMKVLISITPNGAFSFVSSVWNGSISDRLITIKSGIVNLIEEGDVIMCDRGFTIRDILLNKQAFLNMPPFTSQGSLTQQETLETRRIASVRIHVERAIRSLKAFRMLSGIIQLTYKPLLDQMVIVAAAICNLNKSLVTR